MTESIITAAAAIVGATTIKKLKRMLKRSAVKVTLTSADYKKTSLLFGLYEDESGAKLELDLTDVEGIAHLVDVLNNWKRRELDFGAIQFQPIHPKLDFIQSRLQRSAKLLV